MKKIESKKIFVLCPANNKTGGTELLHQFVDELNNIKKDAYIVYYYEGKYNKQNPTPEEFKKYNIKYCRFYDIEDSEENILILPEVCIGKNRKFKKIRKAVWWLSVDNYKVMCGYKNRLKKYGVLSFVKHLFLNDFFNDKDLKKIRYHLFQSYFAQDFLLKKGIKSESMFYLSDYINDIYMNDNEKNNKEDIIIYNPKKGFEFTKKLIERSNFKWVAIKNMTNIEVQNLMKKAKIYIDFGNHPGKDRIPREAAMSGCCIFTNKRGAAAYYEDVPISDEYKYDDIDDNINIIINKLQECMNCYELNAKNFDAYREFIKNEKKIFKKNVLEIFG